MSGPNYVYFDLETQKSAAEVGGWHNKRAMKIALGVTYSTHRGTYEIYREDDVYALLQELQRADRGGRLQRHRLRFRGARALCRF